MSQKLGTEIRCEFTIKNVECVLCCLMLVIVVVVVVVTAAASLLLFWMSFLRLPLILSLRSLLYVVLDVICDVVFEVLYSILNIPDTFFV